MESFDYDQDLGLESGFDVESFLEESQHREQQRLDQELERIRNQLEDRKRIHREILDELESKRDWYIQRLEKLYRQSFGKEEKKRELKQKVEEFYREIRKEKQKHWRDRQDLEKERRELLREMDNIDTKIFDELF